MSAEQGSPAWPQTAVQGRASVLVIDRDPGSRRYLARVLRGAGYAVSGFGNPATASPALTEAGPDVVLLALDPKAEDWLGMVRACRAAGAPPVLVLAENGDAAQVARLLDAGVDDCLATPFDPADLAARIVRLLRLSLRRRGVPVPAGVGEAQLDLVRPCVRLRGREVRLTRLEYRTLWVLMEGKGAVMTFRDIETRVWGYSRISRRDALRRVVHNLRLKLGKAASGSIALLTERAVGYRLALAVPQ